MCSKYKFLNDFYRKIITFHSGRVFDKLNGVAFTY